jgi:peptidyl-Asp metalloendopeptidase
VFCGIGYQGATKNRAFSVSNYKCATGYYSFGHEIGHNLNANHDRGTLNACGSPGYNYGYNNPKAAFRSIMAYDCKIGQCDNMPKNGCPRVQRFSSPNILYNGSAIGSATEDNARMINERLATVAAFYPAMNCKSNADCNDRNPITVDTCNTNISVCVFT